MSLALSTLLFEWRRYMAAVMALALSGLLVLAMTGVFIGIGLIAIAMVSGLLSLGILKNSQPADLLR